MLRYLSFKQAIECQADLSTAIAQDKILEANNVSVGVCSGDAVKGISEYFSAIKLLDLLGGWDVRV